MLSERPTEREAGVVDAQLEYLQQLTAEGRVPMAGRTLTADERTFGLVVLVAESATAGIVANDPVVQQGVMSAELFPHRVAL